MQRRFDCNGSTFGIQLACSIWDDWIETLWHVLSRTATFPFFLKFLLDCLAVEGETKVLQNSNYFSTSPIFQAFWKTTTMEKTLNLKTILFKRKQSWQQVNHTSWTSTTFTLSSCMQEISKSLPTVVSHSMPFKWLYASWLSHSLSTI